MELSEESLARLEEFHGAVSQPIADDGANREVALETDSFTAEGAATPARAADSRGRTKVWKAASLFALLVGVAGGAYFLLPIPFGAEPDAWSESAGAPADGDLVARGSSPPPPDVATGPEAKRIAESTEPRPGGMAAADELVLETLQDPVEEAPSMLEVTGMETETSFALDDLMPPAASFVPDVASLVPHGDDSDRPESDSTPDPADSVAAELAPESMPDVDGRRDLAGGVAAADSTDANRHGDSTPLSRWRRGSIVGQNDDRAPLAVSLRVAVGPSRDRRGMAGS